MAQQDNTNIVKFDVLKWTVIGFLFVAGIVANYYFNNVPLPLRLVGWLILVLIALGIAYTTYVGGIGWKFFKESRNEMRKVVWPTRQHTFHTTLVVVAISIILAIFLWGVDVFFMWFISQLTG